MPQPSILCTACSEPVEFKTDKEYKEHLMTVHGASTTRGAMDIEKAKKLNTPTSLPPGISEKDLPSKEFLETLKRVEEEKKAVIQPTPPPTQVAVPAPQPVAGNLELKYRYEGKSDCGHDVKTIMLEAEGKLFAVGYDLVCDKMVKRIEVQPIRKEDEHGTNGTKTEDAKQPKVRNMRKTN